MPTILAVCVSGVREVEHEGKIVRTGIYKAPAAGPLRVGREGIEGDRQADRRHHGGADMAVYAYPESSAQHWRSRRGGRPLAPGAVGENLRVDGVDEWGVRIGDRWRAGAALLEVSQPRIPCATLAMAMEDRQFPEAFLKSLRVGFFFRVVEEGAVAAGDAMERVSGVDGAPTIAEVTRLRFYAGAEDGAAGLRAATIPALAPGWREALEKRFSRAGNGD